MVKPMQHVVDSVLLVPSTAATAVRTANLDCQGANYATIRVLLGAELNTNAANSIDIQLSESDDTVVTNFATFDADFNRALANGTAGVVATNHVDLEGRKRFIKLTVTPDTTTNDTVISSAIASLQKDVMSGTASDYGDDVVIG